MLKNVTNISKVAILKKNPRRFNIVLFAFYKTYKKTKYPVLWL